MDETTPPPSMSGTETNFTAPKMESGVSNLDLHSLESFNFTAPAPAEITAVKSAVDIGNLGNTHAAMETIANLPEVKPPVNEELATAADVGKTVPETQVPQTPPAEVKSTGSFKPEDGKKMADEAEDFLADKFNERQQNQDDKKEPFNPDIAQVIPVDKKPENGQAPQGQAKTAEVDPAGRDFANAGKKEEVKLPYGMTKDQYKESQKKHYAREVENGRISQEDADRKIADSLNNYDQQYKEDNPNIEEEDSEAVKTPEEQTAEIIDNIREGKGDLMENLIMLEYVQVIKVGGGELSPEMRNALADMLQTQMESQDKVDNKEALTVIQQIAEMIGMEGQLKKIPQTLEELDKKADTLDEKISRMENEIRFNNTDLDQKERNEQYEAYVMLTQTEAQMVHLVQLQDKMAQRYKEISNNIDYTLGRKNKFSYAWGAVKNSFGRMTLNLSTPSLRSARHRGKFGF